MERESLNRGPILPITSVVERVADTLNIGQRNARRITKANMATGTEENKLHPPKMRKRSKPVVGIDSFDADVIRRRVQILFTEGVSDEKKVSAITVGNSMGKVRIAAATVKIAVWKDLIKYAVDLIDLMDIFTKLNK